MIDERDRELLDRTLRQATEAHDGEALDAALSEAGWLEALASDPGAAIGVLFECQGQAGATSSALDDVIAGALGTPQLPGHAVVLPGLDRSDPPGTGAAGGAVLAVDGLATFRVTHADTTVVVAAGPSGLHTAVVETTELAARTVGGMDPRLGLVALSGSATAVSVSALRPDRWPTAVARARLALGHELVGAATAMLELARVHALERVQFGRPISAFQAVRHRLADAYVAVAEARALLDVAWEAGTAESAAMAKAVAGRAARTVAAQAQQVLAGMGFTTAHPFQRYLRRVLVLEELFGSARSLTAALGRDVLSSRRLPTLPPL